MKKILALLLCAVMMMSVLVACGEKTEAPETDAPAADDTAADTEENKTPTTSESALSLSEIIVKLNEQKTPEFMTGEMPVDITDAEALKYMTGLGSAEKIKEAAVHESMMGAQAYSLVLVRLNNPADAEAVATEMKEGIDPRKWICVEADDMRVVACGDIVMLVMISSEYASAVTAEDYVNAFKVVVGEPSVDLK